MGELEALHAFQGGQGFRFQSAEKRCDLVADLIGDLVGIGAFTECHKESGEQVFDVSVLFSMASEA